MKSNSGNDLYRQLNYYTSVVVAACFSEQCNLIIYLTLFSFGQLFMVFVYAHIKPHMQPLLISV